MQGLESAEFRQMEDAIRRFAEKEVLPHLEVWEAAGEFPCELYGRVGDLGWLAMGFDEAYGGIEASMSLRVAFNVLLARSMGSGGLMAGLFSHTIGLPPIARHGSDALKRAIMPDVLSGRKISALAITEPGGGSDVASLRTRATREGDHYVINGEKTFITSGMRADWITLAVATDPGKGAAGGISMLAVPGDTPGLSRSRLNKMGWLCSDTAILHFQDARVPVTHLIGEEGAGFKMIMSNFNAERLMISAIALGSAQCCHDEALRWARDRRTFGKALIDHQVIRHKLVDMRMRIESTKAWLASVAERGDQGDTGPEWVAEVCMLKNHATQAMQFCADQAVQILGGMGYMRGSASERLYREVKVLMIGGGAEEIMKELAARQLGL